MKNRRTLLLTILAAALILASLVWFDPTRVLWGSLRGEAFFDGRPVSYWRQSLQSGDPVVQSESFEKLGEGGAASVPILASLLQTRGGSLEADAEVRWKAAALLGKIGKPAREALPALVTALNDTDLHVRTVTAAAVAEVAEKSDADRIVPALMERVRAGGRDGVAACRALSVLKGAASPAITVLMEALASEDSEMRFNAARTLGKIGEPAKEAVPRLLTTLESEKHPKVREHLAEALGDIGPSASAGVPALLGLLKDPVPRVRRDAARSLGQIGDASAVSALEGLTKDPDSDVRQAVERAIRILKTGPR